MFPVTLRGDSMNRSVQIDYDLFIDLCSYFLRDEEYLAPCIREQLQDKCDSLVSRALFTRYKRAATAEEREEARQAYLDQRGILPDFRTAAEVPAKKL